MRDDIRIAKNCLAKIPREERPRYNIGILIQDLESDVNITPAGTVVIYKEELDQKETFLKPYKTGTIAVEKPMTQEEIEQQRAEGSSLITRCLAIDVPKNYVEKINP